MEKPLVISQGATKWDVRQKVWDYMEQKNLANFPRPVHHRIPNFKAAAQGCNKLLVLQEFKSSRVVKINPDRPQEQARFNTLNGAPEACIKLASLEAFHKTKEVKVDPDKPLEVARLAALQAKKTLLVPTPRLRTGLFNRIVPPQSANKEELRVCSTSQGVKEFSVPVGLDARVQVDLVVVGSVAVSEKGYRIGKGEGFADMEYAMMASMGAVNESTVVVTIVHDCQVVDIPEGLIESHDLTVDYVLTPTRMIKTECKDRKPVGIIWSKLDAEMLQKIPILKKLRVLEQKAGKDVTLKVSPAKSEHTIEESKAELQSELKHESKCDTRCGHKKGPKHQHAGLMVDDSQKLKERNAECECAQGRVSTLYLGGIPAGLRVNELKGMLRERNVMPLQLTWQGAQHRAFLEYSNGSAADRALAALQGLSINGHSLNPEPAKSQRGRPGLALQRPRNKEAKGAAHTTKATASSVIASISGKEGTQKKDREEILCV